MASADAASSRRINPRMLLLAVIVICAAIIAFGKMRQRSAANAMRPIVLGPLHPLTPPITADKLVVMADLRAHNYDHLDAMLIAYQTAAEHDVKQEINAHQAFTAFAREDPFFDAALREWIKRSPKSYSPLLAYAEFLIEQGSLARGEKWAYETSAEQMQRMNQFADAGANEARAALALNPKLADAYALLIHQKMTGGAVGDCISENDAGLKQIPASFVVRDATMNCLKPRWGGSYVQMHDLAQKAQDYVGENPLLSIFKGFVASDEGQVLGLDNRFDLELEYQSHALAEGGDYWSFYNHRGETLMRLNRFAEGYADMSRANQLLPQDSNTLVWMAYGLSALGRNQEALADLDKAVDISGSSPDEQQIRKDVVTALTPHARATGASGN